MVQIRMVGPLYIDDDLEPKKFESLFKMAPGGGPDPHFGTLFWRYARTVISRTEKGLSTDLGVPEIDFNREKMGLLGLGALMAFGRWAVRVYFISGRLDQSNEY